MVRARNKRYPNYSLSVAVDHIRKVFDADWTNTLCRETVAQHLGYGGLSGASDSCIGTLRQYGLLERIGKNEMKVSQLAIDILQPVSSEKRQEAIDEAAFCPPLFCGIINHFPDHVPSEAALRNYLAQRDFQKKVIDIVIKSFADTISMTTRSVSHENDDAIANDVPEHMARTVPLSYVHSSQTPPSSNGTPMAMSAYQDGFSEWFRVKVGKDQLISIAYRGEGEIGVPEIEKVIALLEAQKLVLES